MSGNGILGALGFPKCIYCGKTQMKSKAYVLKDGCYLCSDCRDHKLPCSVSFITDQLTSRQALQLLEYQAYSAEHLEHRFQATSSYGDLAIDKKHGLIRLGGMFDTGVYVMKASNLEQCTLFFSPLTEDEVDLAAAFGAVSCRIRHKNPSFTFVEKIQGGVTSNQTVNENGDLVHIGPPEMLPFQQELNELIEQFRDRP